MRVAIVAVVYTVVDQSAACRSQFSGLSSGWLDLRMSPGQSNLRSAMTRRRLDLVGSAAHYNHRLTVMNTVCLTMATSLRSVARGAGRMYKEPGISLFQCQWQRPMYQSRRDFGSTAPVLKPGKDRTAYIAFGSNVGDRIWNIEEACRRIDKMNGTRISRTSGLWETEPMYVEDQDKFLNGVCEVRDCICCDQAHVLGINRP
jgi:7,8-dihydro-6-hydroxymethylpterin-pyrophosphokinase (HPPK)